MDSLIVEWIIYPSFKTSSMIELVVLLRSGYICNLSLTLSRRHYLVPTNFVPKTLVQVLSNYWSDIINSYSIFKILVFSSNSVYKTCFYYLLIKSKCVVKVNQTLRQNLIALNALGQNSCAIGCTIEPPFIWYIQMCILIWIICFYFSFIFAICSSNMSTRHVTRDPFSQKVLSR